MPRTRLSGLEIVLQGVKEVKPEVMLDKNHNLDTTKCSNHDEDANYYETKDPVEIFIVNNQEPLIVCNKKIRGVGNHICEVCGKSFSRKWHLHRHMEKVHQHCLEKDSCFRCTECDYEARNMSSVSRHFGRNHGEKSTKCDLCGHSFGSEIGLSKHKELKHSTEYHCGECPYIGPNLRSLKRHMKKHEGITFSCDECKITFTTHEQLYAHTSKCTVADQHKEVKIKLFKCGDCGSAFATERNLMGHVNLKHNHEWKNFDQINCDQCDFVGKNEGSIQYHKRKHEGKTYSCEKCAYTAPTMDQLRNHVNSTHCELKLLCEFCDFKFSTNWRLKQHVQRRHILTQPDINHRRETGNVRNAKTDYLHVQMINEVKHSLGSDRQEDEGLKATELEWEEIEVDCDLDHYVKVEGPVFYEDSL